MQDHFAAAFGGCNFIDYHANGSVSVEPIDLNENFIRELESSLISIYTGTSRESAHIIEDQQAAMANEDQTTIDSLKKMKLLAIEMRRSIRKEDIIALGKQLHDSWILKKSTSDLITNDSIDTLYKKARDLGAYGGKIAGAGGGGYLMLLASPESRNEIVRELVRDDMVVLPIVLTSKGAEAWEVKS
jgi:D-glycero-alpha-D-manno-heptose-7-phosphate kinase